MNAKKICAECGGKNLQWTSGIHNAGGCVDGRIRMHEVQGIFILGCVDCSATVQIVDADKVAAWMNSEQSLQTV